MGDALSHAVLPGIVIAYLISGSRASVPLFLGAIIMGIITTHRLMLPCRRFVLPKTPRRHYDRAGCLSSAPLPRPPNQSWRLSARPCSITGLFLGAYFIACFGILGAAVVSTYFSLSFPQQMSQMLIVAAPFAVRMIRWRAVLRLTVDCAGCVQSDFGRLGWYGRPWQTKTCPKKGAGTCSIRCGGVG